MHKKNEIFLLNIFAILSVFYHHQNFINNKINRTDNFHHLTPVQFYSLQMYVMIDILKIILSVYGIHKQSKLMRVLRMNNSLLLWF